MHLVKKNDSKIPSCFDLLNITITLLLKVKKDRVKYGERRSNTLCSMLI